MYYSLSEILEFWNKLLIWERQTITFVMYLFIVSLAITLFNLLILNICKVKHYKSLKKALVLSGSSTALLLLCLPSLLIAFGLLNKIGILKTCILALAFIIFLVSILMVIKYAFPTSKKQIEKSKLTVWGGCALVGFLIVSLFAVTADYKYRKAFQNPSNFKERTMRK